ncbi:tyrosine-type recombinase/integrase [Paraburkholderia acidisoli]|uniref:Tyrosine-type recombinase/integrase n=1 Tax=Paraburkholderia acidisoli TaxID=2571748 RepID=A0A7Z2JH21_9BURK|nr:tyrosine-type recombinase/integrase [Paraburkholderia acidisoli]
MVRINEICAVRWREHINFAKATWFIPPERAKNKKGHTVHLSAFSMKLLRELHTVTGRTPFLLPHPHDSTKPYSVTQGHAGRNERWRYGDGGERGGRHP